MSFSERVCEPDYIKSPETTFKECILSDDDLKELDHVYLQILPAYKLLEEKYQAALQQAANARRKSLFPCRSEWQSPALSPLQQEMLPGPLKNIAVAKKMEIRIRGAPRSVTYSSSCYEPINARHSCSYVRVTEPTIPDPDELSLPVLGRIKQLFTHRFASVTYSFATIFMYDDMHKDSESELFWVNPSHTHKTIVPISKLSPPLTVAKEDEQLWFLDV